MKYTPACFIFMVLIAGRTAAQTGAPTLRELADSAIRNDHILANKQLDVELTTLDQEKLKNVYLPHVDLTVKDAFILSSFGVKSRDLINIPQLNIDIKTGSNRFTTSGNLLTADIGASMLLYSGGKVPQLKRALASKSSAQQIIMESDRQQIISNVITAYDQLALLKQVRKVLDESEKRLAENKRTADKAFTYGLITKYEHQKIEVAQAQLAAKIQEYEGKQELVIDQLAMYTHIDKERLRQIDASMELVAVSTEAGSITNRAELKALDAKLEASQYKINAEKTWFVPKIQAAASVGYVGLLAGRINSSRPLLTGVNSPKLRANLPNLNIIPMFNIGVGLKWDLFDGHEGSHEVKAAQIEYKKTSNEKQDALEKLGLNLAKCKSDYTIAQGQIALKKAQQQTAQNALTQATKEYRTGLIKTLQLIDAENDYVAAALGVAQSVFDQRRAAFALMMATGNLTIQAIP